MEYKASLNNNYYQVHQDAGSYYPESVHSYYRDSTPEYSRESTPGHFNDYQVSSSLGRYQETPSPYYQDPGAYFQDEAPAKNVVSAYEQSLKLESGRSRKNSVNAQMLAVEV